MIVPGVAGAPEVTVTAEVLAVLVPQALVAVTLILPELTPKLTVMDVVPCPEAMVAPDGMLHV